MTFQRSSGNRTTLAMFVNIYKEYGIYIQILPSNPVSYHVLCHISDRNFSISMFF